MTAQDKPYPVVELLIETFGDWLKHRRELNEMRQMDPADFDRIASWSVKDRMPRMSCRSCSGPSGSTWPISYAPSLWCCVTWSASAPCAITNANATANLRSGLLLNIMRDIAPTRPRSMVLAKRRSGLVDRRPGDRRDDVEIISPLPQSRPRSRWCAWPCRRAAAPPSGRRAGSRRARRSPAARMPR